jgi:multicomponent Na+:H+ antiporter subunit F
MNLIDIILMIVLTILSISLILALIRVVRGPSLPERVVALDLMAPLGVGIIISYAMLTGRAVFIDIAIVVALISFLGTIAFSNYIERRV